MALQLTYGWQLREVSQETFGLPVPVGFRFEGWLTESPDPPMTILLERFVQMILRYLHPAQRWSRLPAVEFQVQACVRLWDSPISRYRCW